MDLQKLSADIQTETEKIIVGKSDKIRLLIMAVLADGHVLLDDLPGVGKPPSLRLSPLPWAVTLAAFSLSRIYCPATL